MYIPRNKGSHFKFFKMNKQEILGILKKHKPTLQQNFHITKIGLFGSYAKNTQTVASDIDLLYELLEGYHLGWKEIYELEVFVNQMFNKKKIDLVNRKYMNPIVENDALKSVVYV